MTQSSVLVESQVKSSVPVVQRSLRVGAVNDPLEGEADAVADRVMRMPSPSEVVQRCPGGCPGDEELRRSPVDEEEDVLRAPTDTAPTGTGLAVDAPMASGISARRGGGARLPESTRGFFEPRFGADFSGVRVHADAGAAQIAAGVNARAFTVGRDVFFGAGEFRPGTSGGDRLLAHELTHTLQQRTQATMRRTVHPARSSCPANVHGASADPLADLQQHEDEAVRMALGASNGLFLEALIRDDPTFGPSIVSNAYLNRFGRPEQTSAGKFRTRFTGSTLFDTENEAISAGMLGLARRFEQLAGLFSRPIDYDCPGTASFTLSGCTSSSCGPNDGATTCPTGLRAIKICAGFWTTMTDAQRAGALIHEAAHILFRFQNHGAGSPNQRRRNPECFTSFLADTEPFAVWDARCPV